MLEIVAALANGLWLFFVNIKTHDRQTALMQRVRQWQADISQTNHAHARLIGFNFCLQGFVRVAGSCHCHLISLSLPKLAMSR